MDRTGYTLPDLDTYLGGETQPAGTDALHWMNSAGRDKSSCRRSCASAWNALMKSRRRAPERERPERRVQLRLCENFRHRRGRLLDLLEQSWPRLLQVRNIRISFSWFEFPFVLPNHFLHILTQTSRDDQRFTGYPCRVIRSEEHRSGCDVLGLADADQRRLGFKHFPHVAFGVTARCGSFSNYHARIDGIHADFG